MNLAIIFAGGANKEFNCNFISLAGKELLLHSIESFEKNDSIDKILVVLRKEETDKFRSLLKNHKYTKLHSVLRCNGNRQESISNALSYLKSKGAIEEDVIIVHNSKNPFVTQREISESISQVMKHGSCVAAKPVNGNLKISNDKFIQTSSQENLYKTHSPLSARFWILSAAHTRANEEEIKNSDVELLIENLGHQLKIIEASDQNQTLNNVHDLTCIKN